MPEPAWKEARPDPVLPAATEAIHRATCGMDPPHGSLVACRARNDAEPLAAAVLAATRPLIEAQARREGAVEALQAAAKVRYDEHDHIGANWLYRRADLIRRGPISAGLADALAAEEWRRADAIEASDG